MRKGRKQKINWVEHESPKFTLDNKSEIECGSWALHTITKVPYHQIMRLSNKEGHWPTRKMLGFLKAVGCEVIPITLGNTVEGHSVKNGKRQISSRNVVLLEQGCYEEESTWSVLHNNQISHSGETNAIGPLEFLNWPILQAYLITHKAWKNEDKKDD
jgi:hypothetical protein